jgi:preprotein translocase subunit SecE
MKNRSAVAKRNVPARRNAPVKRSSRRFGFFTDIIAELKKVVWLSRREAAYLTALVLIVAIVMGLILGLFDYGFTRLVNDIFMA